MNYKSRRVAAAVGLAVCIVLVVYVGAMVLVGNFHEILPGELYRSAQLTPAQLVDYSQHYAIKNTLGVTQLNLQLVDFVQLAVYATKIQLTVIIEFQISTA